MAFAQLVRERVQFLAELGGPKKLVIVPRAGHDDTLAHPDVWARIDAWLERLAPAR